MAVVVRLIGGFDFFQAFMQFLMSVTSISNFVEIEGKHDFSPECNAVENFVGYDGNLAFLASCQAWLLLLPIIYEVSKILIPGIPTNPKDKDCGCVERVFEKRYKEPVVATNKIEERNLESALKAVHKGPVATDEAKKPDPGSSILLHALKYGTIVSPDLWLSTLASMWVRAVRHATPLTTTRDAGKLSEGSEDGSPTENPAPVSADDVEANIEEGKSRTLKSISCFRVVSCGEMSKVKVPCGLYFALPGYSKKVWSLYNDLHVAKNAYHFCVIDRTSGEIESLKAYDIIGDGCASQENKELIALVGALKALGDTKIVVVFTTGMPGAPHPLEGEALGEALNLCGGTDKFFTATEEYSAYVLIGIPGKGKGTGHEVIQRKEPGGKAANIDLNFEITDDGFRFDVDHIDNDVFDNYWCCSNQSYIFAAFQKRTSEENDNWNGERMKRMPSYYTLCCYVHKELHESFFVWYESDDNQEEDLMMKGLSFVALLMTICGFGHFFTAVGRELWYYVIWKYYRFILVCLGYWTDEIVDAYEIHKHVSEMSTVWEKPFERKSTEAYVEHQRKLRGTQDKQDKPRKTYKDYFFSLPEWMTPDGGWLENNRHEETKEMIKAQQEVLKRKLRADYAAAIHAAVATRAVLLQVVPFLSYLSIYATIMSATPISVHSERLASNLPELIISEPFVQARAQEQESIDEQYRIRRAIFTVDQNSRPNPECKRVKGKPSVKVSVLKRQVRERNNKINRDRMKEIIDSPKPRVDEWIIAINGTIMHVTESRGIKFLLNLCKFILTVGMTLTPQDKMKYWMASSVILVTPLCFFAALGIVAFVGKLFHITDDDLDAALGCVGITCFYERLIRYTGGPEPVSTGSGSGDESKVKEISDKERKLGNSSMELPHYQQVTSQEH